MCEYFASHGFIVAAVALKGQHSFSNAASLAGLETAVGDLSFAVNKLLEISQVNADKLCLIGNGITSSQIVAYQTRNSRVDCVVSLDGGLLSQFEQGILDRTPFYSPQAVNKPILAIYAPHPSIDPENIAHLTYADRYYFHFPHMSEFHFLNFGAFDKFVPGIIGKPKGNVRNGFETAALYCLKFFEVILLKNDESKKFLKEPPTGTASKYIDRTFTKKGLPPPPNLTTVKDAFTRMGIDYIEQIYSGLRKDNPAPFSKFFYSDLRDWLAWKKDPDYTSRQKLYKLAHDSYPESSVANYYLAYYSQKTENKKLAIIHYEKAVELVDSDDDPLLKESTRKSIKINSKKALYGLK